MMDANHHHYSNVSFDWNPEVTENREIFSVSDPVSPETYATVSKICMSLRFIFCPWGIFANALNIRTFLRMGLKDNVTICFFALALSDFTYNVVGIAYTSCSIAEKVLEDHAALTRVKSLLYHATVLMLATQNMFLFNTMFTTTFLAVQRSLCVLLPLSFKDILTRARILTVLVVLWSLPTVYYTMLIFSLGLREHVDVQTNQTVFVTYFTPFLNKIYLFNSYGFNVSFASLCHLITIACVFILKYALLKSLKFRKTTSAAVADSGEAKEVAAHAPNDAKVSLAKSSKERQAIVQVSLVCAIQVVTNMPSYLVNAVSLFVQEFHLYKGYHYLFTTCTSFAITSESLNSVFNFFVYYRYSSRFKKLCFSSPKKLRK